MSKIGAYLQEHISGEVSLSRDVRESMSRDGSVLKVKPEMVVYPKNTNDIRKVARFSWQLAERGHVLPITARGSGSDQTGAAIGPGIILSFPAHMNRIFEFEPKQRLVRLQPGALTGSLHAALHLQDARVPALPTNTPYSTVGGAVANNSRSMVSGRHGAMSEWVDRLEVVLANGEVIQTGRIGKKELSRRIGLGTLEGEIYRTLDSLIEDNSDVLDALDARSMNTSAGYGSIAAVKRRDGSFDLTPLFIGSQGTLGIISEMIIKGAETPENVGVLVAAFSDADAADDAIDDILSREDPAFLESYDSEVFEQAAMLGKRYAFLEEPDFDVKKVLLIGFEGGKVVKSLKKAEKILSGAGAWYVSGEGANAESLMSMRNALVWTATTDRVDFGAPSILGSAYVPTEGLSVFRAGLKLLSKKHGVAMPMYGQETQNLYYVWPLLNLKKTGDKQKMLLLLEEYSRLVQKVEGELIGAGGEGRLRSRFALNTFDDASLKLFTDIKTLFDPFKMLNPGVKELIELKKLAPMIQSDYASAASPNFIPYL